MADLSFSELRDQAVGLGLTGESVGQYIMQQQAAAREERAQARQLEKQKIEAEASRIEAEREKVKLAHELELAKLGKPVMTEPGTLSVNQPRLPEYKDGEDMASYLVRFERVGNLLGIPENSYAVRLGSLLTGKAVDIYTSLSPEVTSDYAQLKQSLLQGFNKTPSGYRKDFRSAKIRVGETYKQFSVQLGRLFDQWIDGWEVEKTYEGLRSFMILDQFTSSLTPELRVFVKEQDGKTLEETVKLADNWAGAHNAYPKTIVSDQSKKKSDYKSSAGSSEVENKPGFKFKGKCHNCGEMGHLKAKCPRNPAAFKESTSSYQVQFCFEDSRPRDYVVPGTVNGCWVSTIHRDTACTCVLVANDVLPDVDPSVCKMARVVDYLGRVDYFPLVKCYIKCPYYEGWVEAVRAPLKFCSVLLGNVKGTSCPDHHYQTVNTTETVQAVQTRSQKAKRIHPLVLPKLDPLNITPTEFAKLQVSCPSLSSVRDQVKTGESNTARDGSVYKFVESQGLLYRTCIQSRHQVKIGQRALVIPAECRRIVISVSHESPLAGHFSHRKTLMRVVGQFYWPNMIRDIKDFCNSCDKCQRMSPKGRVKPVPLQQLPIVTEPFSRVSIDLVGPLIPTSEGHRYILTLIDFSTGFPEALPLKEIDSVSVAEALLVIFSRVGIPKEILSDRGTQFTSQLMAELHKLLGVKPLFTTPYHPSGNGRIERFHSTLKSCLRKLCEDKPREWHRYLVPTLFALREIPSDRTGFSAFELLYGRAVRGPLAVLRDLWEDRDITEDDRTSFQYVIELKEKLADCAKIAAQNADVSSARYRSYFDLKSQNRQFKPGDEVLVLLPDKKSKLLMAWSGPYPVLERRNKVNYLIDENGVSKLYHANLLKRYHRRATVAQAYVIDEEGNLPLGEPFSVAQFCVVDEEIQEDRELNAFSLTPDGCVQLIDHGECVESEIPLISESLTIEQKESILNLISSFPKVFSNEPGCTSLLKHDITLTTSERITPKMYPVPIHLQKHFEQEVDKLYEQGIIRHSNSSYCSPVVMVRKPDGSYRMAIDYRTLNSITEFHAEPACIAEADLHKFSGAKYFSELDLTKAYYQVPLTDRARPLTAFPTHRGLMEFCRMPFGLVTACATYIRLMRLVLAGLQGVSFYFDNVFIYSKSWVDHLETVKKVLERLQTHNLTAKQCKCRFGFQEVKYLGFMVDGTHLRPQNDKIKALMEVPPPKTKKCLRSFLGMVSFYRMFIPHASHLSSCLSDLLRKNVREPLVWTEELLSKFNALKSALSSEPILKLPDANAPFILRTDASEYGLGAVLLQYHEDVPFPVAYASRKLLEREKRYSTIERECLAILFGIKRFEYYLTGKEFILEVDHRPLVYLNKAKNLNNRLTRWALNLQPFRFRLVHIAGADNVGADFLSRAEK